MKGTHSQRFDAVPETYYTHFKVYRESLKIEMDHCFYGALMAAMRMADSDNLEKLGSLFPEVLEVLQLRYHAPAGCLTPNELIWSRGEDEETARQIIDAFWERRKVRMPRILPEDPAVSRRHT